MNIAFIKKANEKMPYWMKKPFAGLIRSKLIENKVFLATYKELEKQENVSQDEIRDIQLTKLRDILVHAYQHTSYYCRLFEVSGFDPMQMTSIFDLEKIPLLTKQKLKDNFEDLQADDIPDAYLVTTGGTSGEPTKVMMERDAIYREWAFIYHYWSEYGYDYKTSRLATFRGVDLGGKINEINPLYAEIRMNPFILSNKNISEYVGRIDKYGADFIYGYPSAVYNFCRLAEEAGIKLQGRFKAALLISENLYPFQEEKIKAVLSCPIAIFYGHSERAVFAERDETGYSFNPYYGITEIAEDGSLIVTGFINHKMPLIRYAVDDAVEMNVSQTYDITGHHEGEVLYGKNGEMVSMAAINFHDDTFDGTNGYQFVQNEPGKCIIRIASSGKLSDEKIDLIKCRVDRKLGPGFICTVEPVDKLELTARGKYRMLIQNSHKFQNPSGGGIISHDIANGGFKIIGHRNSDVIYGVNGEQFRAGMLDFHGMLSEITDGFQIVQNEPGKIIIHIVVKPDNAVNLVEIEKEYQKKLGKQISCKFECTDSLESTSRGKYRFLIQNVDKCTTTWGGQNSDVICLDNKVKDQFFYEEVAA